LPAWHPTRLIESLIAKYRKQEGLRRIGATGAGAADEKISQQTDTAVEDGQVTWTVFWPTLRPQAFPEWSRRQLGNSPTADPGRKGRVLRLDGILLSVTVGLVDMPKPCPRAES